MIAPDYSAKILSMWTGIQCKSELVRPTLDIADRIIKNWQRYETVSLKTGVPSHVLACLHFRESGVDFSKHLANGDPLDQRTVHVPVGRPLLKEPPFTWEESAIDTLEYMGMNKIRSWPIDIALYQMEKWNGLAYKKNGLNSPYIWSWTNYETPGLYVADHKFDPNKFDSRPGCAILLAALKQKGVDIGDLVQK